jgi:hypothetical protein
MHTSVILTPNPNFQFAIASQYPQGPMGSHVSCAGGDRDLRDRSIYYIRGAKGSSGRNLGRCCGFGLSRDIYRLQKATPAQSVPRQRNCPDCQGPGGIRTGRDRAGHSPVARRRERLRPGSESQLGSGPGRVRRPHSVSPPATCALRRPPARRQNRLPTPWPACSMALASSRWVSLAPPGEHPRPCSSRCVIPNGYGV